jgi:hypothetical protein
MAKYAITLRGAKIMELEGPRSGECTAYVAILS